MTDGEFNTFYHGTTVGNDPASAFNRSDESNELAIELCDDMKAPRRGADGITVYSIAFQAPESAEETLRVVHHLTQTTRRSIFLPKMVVNCAMHLKKLQQIFRNFASANKLLTI